MKRFLILSFAFFVSMSISFNDVSAIQDQPTIAKDSVQVTAFTFDVYRKNYEAFPRQSPEPAAPTG